MDDAILHRRLLARDVDVLDDLAAVYGGHMDRLVLLILGRLGAPEDAEEVISDALVAAWQRVQEYEPDRTPLKTWLLMLTKYAALARLRKLRRKGFTPTGERKVLPLSDAPEPVQPGALDDNLLASDQLAEVQRALERLPDADRDLLIRRYYMEEPVMHLAQELGLSRGAMDTRLWRARQTLKRLLEAEAEGITNGSSAV